MKNKDLGLLTIGNIYLRTTKNIINELIKGGNAHRLFGEDIKGYDSITKRSDFNTSIPTLFLLFHGLETTIKGLLIKLGDNNTKKDHRLTNSVEKLGAILNNRNTEFLETLKKYIYKNRMNQTLKDLLEINNQKDSNSFYEFLKYPFNKKEENMYNYLPIKYQENKFLPFANEIIEDINIIIKESIKIYKGKKEKNTPKK